jgi:hypothetical protein
VSVLFRRSIGVLRASNSTAEAKSRRNHAYAYTGRAYVVGHARKDRDAPLPPSRCLVIHAPTNPATPRILRRHSGRAEKVEVLFAEFKNQIGLRRVRRLKFVRDYFF